jgi:hypothetical protein
VGREEIGEPDACWWAPLVLTFCIDSTRDKGGGPHDWDVLRLCRLCTGKTIATVGRTFPGSCVQPFPYPPATFGSGPGTSSSGPRGKNVQGMMWQGSLATLAADVALYLLKPHSGSSGPGAVRGIAPRRDWRTLRAHLLSASRTGLPGYIRKIPLNRSPYRHCVASYAADPLA